MPADTAHTVSGSIQATQTFVGESASTHPQAARLIGPANEAFVHAMHITTLVAALLVLAGGLVVLRWMPGKPRPAAEIAAASEGSYEHELAIMEENVLNTASREG